MTDVWQPLWLSIRIALCATLLATIVGVPIAFGMARRRRFVGKSLLDALVLLPLVLPPTVVGYLLLVMFGARGWFSSLLNGYSIVFRFEGAVLAAAVVALPMIYIPTKAAFASVEREMEDIARLLGANRIQMFWHVSLPMARRGLMSGLILAFARAGRVRCDRHGVRMAAPQADAAHLDLFRLRAGHTDERNRRGSRAAGGFVDAGAGVQRIVVGSAGLTGNIDALRMVFNPL
ncbi:MAG: ABC transporter permease subunit [Tepidisphaeraceae bacterium]